MVQVETSFVFSYFFSERTRKEKQDG
jgi:hypothetical protein